MSKIPQEIEQQLADAIALIQNSFNHVKAIYLYGSAVDGGLKEKSDIDLLVITNEIPDERTRNSFLESSLNISSPPGINPNRRALEITVLAYPEIATWLFPLKREIQFGEWLRRDIEKGVFERPSSDYDLTIILTKVRENSISLYGLEAKELFRPVPQDDFVKALIHTLSLWKIKNDWIGDERNILLTLARIMYSIETGLITSKDAAATWLLNKIPKEYHETLLKARDGYLGTVQDTWEKSQDETKAFIEFTKRLIEEKITTSKKR